MKKWTVEIVGKDEKDVVIFIQAMLDTFKIAADKKMPVHHLELEDNGTHLICKEEK